MRQFYRDAKTNHAFSIVEIIVVIAVLGLISAVAIPLASGVSSATKTAKLGNDLKTINQAVLAYLANGGDLDGYTDPQAVINQLKISLTSSGQKTHVGYSGAVIDLRLAVRMKSDSSAEQDKYVYWNPSKTRFEYGEDGDLTVAGFYLDDSLPGEVTGTRTADTSSVKYNGDDGWIWEYSEDPIPVSLITPTHVALTSATPPTFATSAITVSPVSYELDADPITAMAAEEEPGNRKPTIVSDYPVTAYETQLTIDVLANDSDPDGDGLSIAMVTPAQNGSVTEELGQIHYHPNPGFNGQDIFTYSATDGFGGYGLATVTVTVEDPPPSAIPPQTVTLSFDDPGVDFAGTGNHFFTSIEGSDANLILSVSDTSTFRDGFETSANTGNGDTGAFWLTNGLGSGSTTFTMDISGNAASALDLMVYHINVSGGGDKVTLTALTDSGTTLTNPEITPTNGADFTTDGNVMDAFTFDADTSEANAHVAFTAPAGENIVSVQMKWEESSYSVGGYHGIGLGEITFTYQPEE